jgi:hypothetical protein
MWAGGTAAARSLGGDLYPTSSQLINVKKEIVSGQLPPEARLIAPTPHPFGKWNRALRADIYDELLKLPLRYQLHSFEALINHSASSSVGYAPPLGPVDRDDVIPFFVHRDANGKLPGKMLSLDEKKQLPSFVLQIPLIDGDLWRFEDELIKIFPTKKTFLRSHAAFIFGADRDVKMILHHWMLGMGF